MTDKLRTFA